MPTLSEADQKFVNLAQKLIVEHNLGIGNRVGLFYTIDKIGDTYFFCASINYAQDVLNKHYVVITYKNCPMDIFLNWHNANGANIEKVCISKDDFDILSIASDDIKNTYSGILDSFTLMYYNTTMYNCIPREDVYQNLTRPKLKTIDRIKYIEQYGLIPGKTVFIIPESTYMGTLPLYFWTMSIQLFKLLGYHVLVNSKKNIYGEDVTYCFPPLDDIIGLCNECGTVYAIRTGLAEVVASETTAKIFLFQCEPRSQYNALRSITLMYPFIDNSDKHIVEIIIPDQKEYFYWIKNAQDSCEEIATPLHLNIKLRDRLHQIASKTQYQQASLSSYRGIPNVFLFTDIPEYRCDNFCSVEYKFYTQNNLIYLLMNIKPYSKFIIHIALICKQTNERIKTYYHYNYQYAIFQVTDDNEYYAVVHIVNPAMRRNTIFETHSIIFKCSPKYKLTGYTDYYQYLNHLRTLCDQNLLVFIVYKATPELKQMCQHNWVTLIDHGNVIQQNANLDQTSPIEYEWDGNKASVSSSGWNSDSDNTRSISVLINGKEQAVDHRGFNFVVWDKDDNKLLDSVCFDIFLNPVQVYRP